LLRGFNTSAPGLFCIIPTYAPSVLQCFRSVHIKTTRHTRQL
jgi:hypothetical protein